MEGLFFAVKPLWWSGPIPLISLIIASTIAMMYIVFRFLRSMKPLIGETYPDFTFVGENDTVFAKKTLENLKEYLTHLHNPKRVSAHTVEEIRRYITDKELLTILDTLENSEYSGKSVPIDERKDINTFLTGMIAANSQQPKSEK